MGGVYKTPVDQLLTCGLSEAAYSVRILRLTGEFAPGQQREHRQGAPYVASSVAAARAPVVSAQDARGTSRKLILYGTLLENGVEFVRELAALQTHTEAQSHPAYQTGLSAQNFMKDSYKSPSQS